MKTLLKNLVPALLILLLVYAAVSKLLTFSDFKVQLHNQDIPGFLADLLLYTLPPAELLAAALLYFPRSRTAGLLLSLLLLLAFTGYVQLVIAGYWSRVPCSCGGILSHLGWTAHLVFNWVFLLLNLAALLARPARGRPA